ncbi:MAG: hypothetical protein KatS3mg126_2354 [Lysobacteraceae bacterium]|nr:MAG: hypothetical protein KatS3mg126_2354 [Xanthomonadaceae bacterium]
MAVTLCPMALTLGCKRCPVFRVCPLKSVIGDQPARPAANGEGKPAGPRRDGGTRRKH